MGELTGRGIPTANQVYGQDGFTSYSSDDA